MHNITVFKSIILIAGVKVKNSTNMFIGCHPNTIVKKVSGIWKMINISITFT